MKNEFRLFSFSHLIALSVVTFLIVFILHKLQTCDRDKLRKYLNPWLAFLILFQIVLWRSIFILQKDFIVGKDLPLHLCGLSEMLMVYYLLKPKQVIFDITYYWVITGSVLGVIIPDLHVDFPSPRFFSMFLTHSLIVFVMLYLLIVQKQKPSKNSFLTSFMAMNFYAILLVPVNLLTKGNFLFLTDVPDVKFGPVKLLPEWPWYLIVLELFFLAVFRLAYQPFVVREEIKVTQEREEKLSPEKH